MKEKTFLWAASTSAYQFEGAWNTDGKGLSIQDVKPQSIGDFKVTSDHYHHMEEDVKLLKELGLNAYRFSIAWTRIIPNGIGEINELGIQFYENLITELTKNNITPIITIYHDDLPWELQKIGGWSNRKTIDAFLEYCKILFQRFGNRVGYWQPICEQNLLTIEQIVENKKSLKEIFQENHHMFLAHAKAVDLYHQMNLPGKIGPAPNIVEIYPLTPNPEDVLAAKQMELIRNWFYLDVYTTGEYPRLMTQLLKQLNALPEFEETDNQVLKKGICDYISFSNYTSVTVCANQETDFVDNTNMKYGFNMPGLFKIVKNPQLGKTEFDWEVDPLGTRLSLINVYERYKMPILIIERSLGLKEELTADGIIDDTKRISYLTLQLDELQQAIAAGVEVIGFCTWSAFDLVSTSSGYQKRYGLIYVDRDDQNPKNCIRIPKKSYYWLKDKISQ